MFARIGRIQGSPEQVEAGLQYFQGVTGPVQEMQGFRRAYLLVDREAGKLMTVTLWDTREDVEASAQTADRIRQQGGQQAGASQPWTVEVYEVAEEV